jgi:hypothetical protein
MLASGAAIWLFSNVYLAAQLVVVPGTLIWIYRRSPRIYRRLRNTIVATWLVAVPIFAAYPVAPARLAGVGIADTVSGQAAVGLTGASTHLLQRVGRGTEPPRRLRVRDRCRGRRGPACTLGKGARAAVGPSSRSDSTGRATGLGQAMRFGGIGEVEGGGDARGQTAAVGQVGHHAQVGGIESSEDWDRAGVVELHDRCQAGLSMATRGGGG